MEFKKIIVLIMLILFIGVVNAIPIQPYWFNELTTEQITSAFVAGYERGDTRCDSDYCVFPFTYLQVNMRSSSDYIDLYYEIEQSFAILETDIVRDCLTYYTYEYCELNLINKTTYIQYDTGRYNVSIMPVNGQIVRQLTRSYLDIFEIQNMSREWIQFNETRALFSFE